MLSTVLKISRRRAIYLSSALVTVAFLCWVFTPSKLSADNFVFTSVQRGDLVKTVTASGQINPVNVVTVGTQVSGIIQSIKVDFNDHVSRGETLALLDTSVLQAEVDNSQARLKKAQSTLRLAEINDQRISQLFEKGHVSELELDEAEVELELAEQEVSAMQTQLDRDQVNLGYAVIESPVSGVVISREVDEGQTVAATFQTPELFIIAENLKEMMIETNVTEADIGSIQPGQTVSFIVDAYPECEFFGTIRQIRLDPNIEQNVVTYNVIIDIRNEALLLLPGMTAFVTVEVDQRHEILFLANSAWHFNPNTNPPKKLSTTLPTAANMIYLWREGEVQPLAVERGLTTLAEAEVLSDQLQLGDQVIIDYKV